MTNVDQIVEETRRQHKKFVGEIESAKRLIKLMERAGVPVTEEKIQIQQLNDQAKAIKTALKKDQQENQD